MCFCDKPTINTETWRAPDLQDRDVLLFDEPGRCGGLDHHSHHFRVVKSSSSLYLLVRHGGGDGRIRLFPLDRLDVILAGLDSDSRYWLLSTVYDAHSKGTREAQEMTAATWRRAAAERRIKTRRKRGTNSIKVWIETPLATVA